MTNETYEDTRPLTIRYTIYSAELEAYCPGLPEDYLSLGWDDEMETTLRDFAERYGVELTAELHAEYPERRIRVDVVHATTGGSTYTEDEDEEQVDEIARRVLASIDNSRERS
jgi:hypothetical protein